MIEMCQIMTLCQMKMCQCQMKMCQCQISVNLVNQVFVILTTMLKLIRWMNLEDFSGVQKTP